jgi:hypothetical protein
MKLLSNYLGYVCTFFLRKQDLDAPGSPSFRMGTYCFSCPVASRLSTGGKKHEQRALCLCLVS